MMVSRHSTRSRGATVFTTVFKSEALHALGDGANRPEFQSRFCYRNNDDKGLFFGLGLVPAALAGTVLGPHCVAGAVSGWLTLWSDVRWREPALVGCMAVVGQQFGSAAVAGCLAQRGFWEVLFHRSHVVDARARDPAQRPLALMTQTEGFVLSQLVGAFAAFTADKIFSEQPFSTHSQVHLIVVCHLLGFIAICAAPRIGGVFVALLYSDNSF